MSLPADVGLAIKSNLAVITTLSAQINLLKKRLQENMGERPEHSLLPSVPGIGRILATIILLETGPIDRFSAVGNFASYAFCVDNEGVLNFGKMAFFIEFLMLTGLYAKWIEACPLIYQGPHRSKIADILGTLFLSALSGHKRYAHITTLRSDGVIPELLGMNGTVSEDTVRRALLAIDEEAGRTWLQSQLDHATWPLLSAPWILDVDVTVKPLYGHQEGAVLGYNPKKPGRPSHTYHRKGGNATPIKWPDCAWCWASKLNPVTRANPTSACRGWWS